MDAAIIAQQGSSFQPKFRSFAQNPIYLQMNYKMYKTTTDDAVAPSVIIIKLYAFERCRNTLEVISPIIKNAFTVTDNDASTETELATIVDVRNEAAL